MPMRNPFVVRVHDDDPGMATRLARALEGPLRARGAAARIETSARGRPGTAISIGVLDVASGTRWIEPVELSTQDPEQIVGYLERWGFIVAPTRGAS